MKSAPFELMLVVDPRMHGVLDALARFSALASGEHVAVQLRAKDASDAELISLARSIAAVQPPMSRLIVNGRADVARSIAADGVHLPESAPSVREIRALVHEAAIIGASCHDAVSVERRAAEGADYVLVGPLGEVPDKPAMGSEMLASIAGSASVPELALGGIDSERAADHAMSLGASGIAVQRALLSPDGPVWLARWLTRRLTNRSSR